MDQKNIQRRQLLKAGLALGALPAWQLAAAQDKYPSRPVRIIVPLPPGGAADVSVRSLVNVMAPTFGQPLIIDNKPGGALLIAINALKSAPADGYTLMYVHTPFLSTQAAFKKFDFFKTVVPVAGLGETDIVFAVNGAKGHKNVAELIAYGKANPGKLNYASPGSGTLEHVALANFCKVAGIEAVHVPLKGGPDVVKSLLGNETDFGCLAIPLVTQFQADHRLRALVLLNDKRNPALPDVPTYVDAGLALSRVVLWGGMAAPVGTPPEVLAHLEKVVLEAARNPELQKLLSAGGMKPYPITSADFGKMWRDDMGWIGKAVADNKIELN